MTISGFTIIRNGNILGYPYLESIQSVLPICDEFIAVVGDSTDGTRESILSLKSPKIKIIDTIWDENLRKGGQILAQQTNIALSATTGTWGLYLQGDEVIHEKYLDNIVKAMHKWENDARVEGLLFKYKHFYGSYDYIAKARQWYRYEIRAIKKDPGIYSYRDAQGFRKKGRKLRVKTVDAEVYHYGWCRPPKEQQKKQWAFHKLYHSDEWLKKHVKQTEEYDYSTNQLIEKFTETHPMVMKSKIESMNWEFEYDPKKTKISLKDRFIFGVEKMFGFRPWEYKNYKII
ncbi:MAG: glycosyltransferase family 2 protein [Cytophagaceae bacterium]|nr:glycosyltransferase family 2 protein [Cytophagaceae bacterium]MDW8456635.1 glycosyltransferase family 2 protein [Cytophagaceae bacterium]